MIALFFKTVKIKESIIPFKNENGRNLNIAYLMRRGFFKSISFWIYPASTDNLNIRKDKDSLEWVLG